MPMVESNMLRYAAPMTSVFSAPSLEAPLRSIAAQSGSEQRHATECAACAACQRSQGVGGST